MSHALHRHGTAKQLQNDYTFYARASRFVNREGCGPKLRKILSIALDQKNLVNYGSSQAGKSFKAGLKADEYAATLDKAYGVAGCFSDKEAVRSLLKKLKEADTGISIVISGLIDDSPPIAIRIAAGEGEALAWIYRNGRVLSREDEAEGGVTIVARLDTQALGRFERQFPDAFVMVAA